MKISDVYQMLAQKGNLCVSIVIPTHRFIRERNYDRKAIRDNLLKAKDLLKHSAWDKEKIQQLNVRLDQALDKIDYLRLQEGLVILISPEVSRIFLLPVRVKEKIIISKTFEIRDLLYYAQFLKTYYMLTVSKKKIRLLKGEGQDLQEITNNDFPRTYVEEYEYARPSLGSSSGNGLKDFERDKSILQHIRQNSFLKKADDAVDKYLKSDIPLFVAGVGEQIANYEHVTHHLSNIAGKISGNYDHDAVHPLAEIAWKKMQGSIKASHWKMLIQLQESVGRGLAADGICDVWMAAHEGKGLTLLVEKDYQIAVYADPTDMSKVFLNPPSGKYEIITDAVEKVTETVIEKGGNIVIVENDELENYNRIALLLRYTGYSMMLKSIS